MAADERPECQQEQKLPTLSGDSPGPPLTLDGDCGETSMEATPWPGENSTFWPSKSALTAEDQKGNISGDEDSTTGRMTVDELEHELAVERTKRLEVSTELQESARVGQMLLDRNELLEQEVLGLQQRLEASRSEATKDSDGDINSRVAEAEHRLQQSAMVGQMLLDRNEELEKEAQMLRKQVAASRAKAAKGSEDSDSEFGAFRATASLSSRARPSSACSERRDRAVNNSSSFNTSSFNTNSFMSEGSCASAEAAPTVGKDREALSSDTEALIARNDFLEAENERLREQFHEAPHRKHTARRRFSTGTCNEPESQRTESLGGDEELSSPSRSNRRRLTSGATDDDFFRPSCKSEDVIQGFGGGTFGFQRTMTMHEDLRAPDSDQALLREHLQEAIEQNQILTEEVERLEAVMRKQLERERELTDLLEQERSAAEWAAKEAAREVHGARQAGLDAGLEVVRERRRSLESERRSMESRRSSNNCTPQKEPTALSPASDSEGLSDSDSEKAAELQARLDEMEVKYNEAKHQAWEAHRDMMDTRGLLSATQVNCQDLEDMAAEKQLALEEEQRRNSSLSEQIQELRHMLEDQRRRQSVLSICKTAHSASDASEGSSHSGSNQRDGTFQDLVHLHRLASRSLPMSVASSRRGSVSRQGSRDSLRSNGVESIRTVKSIGRGTSRLSFRETSANYQLSLSDGSTESVSGSTRSPRSRLREESEVKSSNEKRLTLNALLKMENKRISERSEEDRASSSVKDQSAASLELGVEEKARKPSGDISSNEDLESRSSSGDGDSTDSLSEGSCQHATIDSGIEDFQMQSRALLQALLVVTREKPQGTSKPADSAESRAAKVRQLFLSDIAKMEDASSQPVRPQTQKIPCSDQSHEDADARHESQENVSNSRIKSLQARWQNNFAKEVAALADPCQPEQQQTRRPHADSCSFVNIASDGAEEQHRKPTEMLDSFLAGVDFPEEAKRHSEPPISLAAEAGLESQLDTQATKVRHSWMPRSGWRFQGNAQEQASDASRGASGTGLEPSNGQRRTKWSFNPGRLFKGSSRSTSSATTAVTGCQAAAVGEQGAAAEADDVTSDLPSANCSANGSSDKAVSPDLKSAGTSPHSQSRSSNWSFGWGGSQMLGRNNTSKRRTLRVAVGGLDEGTPLECAEDGMSEAREELTDELSVLPPAATSSSAAVNPDVPDEEERRGSSVSGQCRHCGQLVEYCECALDGTRQRKQTETEYVAMQAEVQYMTMDDEEDPSDFCGQRSLCRQCGQPTEYCDCRWDELVSPSGSRTATPAEAEGQASEDPDSDDGMEEGAESMEPEKPLARRKFSLMDWMAGDEALEYSY